MVTNGEDRVIAFVKGFVGNASQRLALQGSYHFWGVVHRGVGPLLRPCVVGEHLNGVAPTESIPGIGTKRGIFIAVVCQGDAIDSVVAT